MPMKDKFTVLIIIFFCLGLTAHAQKPKSFVELSAGVSVPSGDFAATDFSKPESGFANNGFGFNLTYENRLTYNFGISGARILNSHSVNQQAYRDEISADTLSLPLTISTRNWGTFGLLAGPFLYLPVSKYFSVDFRALGGFYSAYSPEVIISGKTEAGENFSLSLLKYNGVGFAFDLATTLRLKFGTSSYLLIKGDYLYSAAKFKDIEWLNRDGEVITRSFDQNLQTINITAGVGYAL